MAKDKVSNQYTKIIDTLHGRRYILIRFITAILFFLNLYWMLALSLSNRKMIFLPFFLFLTYVFAYADLYLVVKKSNHKNLKWTKIVYNTNLIFTCFIFLISLYKKEILFPFVSEKFYALSLLIITSFMMLIAKYRIYRVTNNKDKMYKKIQDFERNINKKGSKDV